ncbi:MAG: hypothetical protein C0P72_008360 [Clostridia bacterium]
MVIRRTDITVVTSCSLAGWEEYGQHCIANLLRYWPDEVTVYLISEDSLPLNNLPLLPKDRLVTCSLTSNPNAVKFYEKNKFNAQARGRIRSNIYRYSHDAWKFSKKVYAIELAASFVPVGKLIWLDADVNTFKPIPIEFLHKMCPDSCNISFLSRRRWHSECGFVGYNLNTQKTREFITAFADVYTSGLVFHLREWHDSFVFDWLRAKHDLACYKIPNGSEVHPFNYSELGHYMDHWKGNRKNTLGSPDHPLRRPIYSKARTKEDARREKAYRDNLEKARATRKAQKLATLLETQTSTEDNQS